MKNWFVLFSLVMGLAQAHALPVTKIKKFADVEALFAPDAGDYDFRGIVKLSNCSGSLIRFENTKDTDTALILTNGHCVNVNGGMMKQNSYVSHRPVSRSFKFLNANGSLKNGSVTSTEVLYGTMTGTDIGIYALDVNYAQIKAKFDIEPLTLDAVRPTEGTEIQILSGYWQKGYSCQIDKFIFSMLEDDYRWTDSIRYTPTCDTIHGTSGSPILSKATRRVIGINNTGNDDGEKCTMNNPCEIAEDGTIYYKKGLHYGQQVYQINTCVTRDGTFDLKTPGCTLFQDGQAI